MRLSAHVLVQRYSRRRRSADLPYFSKSYLISRTLSMDGVRGSDLKVFVGGALQAVGFAADALAGRAHEPVVQVIQVVRAVWGQ